MIGKTEEKKRKDRLLYWGSLNFRLFIKLIGRRILIILLFCYLGYAIVSYIVEYHIA